MLWLYLWVFVLRSVAAASSTTEESTLNKDAVSVKSNFEKLGFKFTEICQQPKCDCSVEIIKAEKKCLSVKKQNQSVFNFDFLYVNQVEEIDENDEILDLSIQVIGLWLSQGNLEKAAKQFNKLPNNILLIKQVVNSSSQKYMLKLLEFVALITGYEQKILMTIMLYTEFMKSIDVTLLPQFQATLVELVEIPEFDMLNSFYQDQIKTMKLVLKALDEKVEAFIPKEKPEDITMNQINDRLNDIMHQQTGNLLYILTH